MGSETLETASTCNASESSTTKEYGGIMWQLAEEAGEEKALLFSIVEARNDRRWSSGEQTRDNVEERTGLPRQCS